MTHLGTLRDYHFSSEIDDVRGATVYGQNLEPLGTIDDVIFDSDSGRVQFAIIDTGGWLRSRRFVVPADRVQPHPENREEFLVELSREQIESLPEFREELVESEPGWAEYEQRFRQVTGWSPIVAAEVPAQKAMTADELAALRSPTGTPPEVAGQKTTAEVRRRWAMFQENLQRDRERILLHRAPHSDVDPEQEKKAS